MLTAVLPAVIDMPAGGATPTRIAHPTEAGVVIFHTESSPNIWGGVYRDATDVTVFGDGRAVYGDGSQVRVSERGLQRLLRGARAAGLLNDTDFGQVGATDQGTTAVDVNAGGDKHSTDIYALELPEGDRGLPQAQKAARRHVRRFLRSVGDPSYWNGTLITR